MTLENKKKVKINVSPLCIAIICVMLFAVSCQKSDERRCIKSSGEYAIYERPLEHFTKVVLQDNMHLTIIPDSIDFLRLEAPSNLADFITSDVKDKVLFLRNTNRCNWLRSYNNDINIELHSSNISSLEYRGSGDVNIDGCISGDSFNIDVHDGSGTITAFVSLNNLGVKIHNGVADIYVSGSSGYTEVYNAGRGYIYLQDCKSSFARVIHRGTGDCHVKAVSKMDIFLEYVGNVHYYGQPDELYTHVTGSGQIIAH